MKPINFKRIDHVSLTAADLDATVDFYTRVLGAEVGGLGMEIHSYEKPFDAAQSPPRNSDVGSRHLCIEVDDIDGAIELLEKNGCKAMAGSIDMMDGPCLPSRSWYVLDPFGNQLELVQYH